MSNAVSCVRSAAAALAVALAFSIGAAAQQKTTDQQFKNIQVLKGIPADQLNPAMHLIEGELGVTCGFCHIVDQWDKDDVPQKATARKMMTMMSEINKNNFEGKQVVTCYTCHRGNPSPVSTLMLPPTSIVWPPYDPEWHPAKNNYPSAEQIFDKYVQALGGEAALRKVTSRVITSNRTVPIGVGGSSEAPAQGQMYFKAPNMTLSTAQTDKASTEEGFDGTAAWTQNANGQVNALPTIDQARAKRNANFYQPLELKQEYTKAEVTGMDKVNNHDVYVVVGTPGNDAPETLYFDTQTGLLLKKVITVPTVVGASPYEVEYDDYRKTNSGVKIPFLIRSIPASPRAAVISRVTIKVQKVQDNAPIDDSKFVKPQSKPMPAK